MAKRIEHPPVVGGTYWDTGGECTVLFAEKGSASGYYTVNGEPTKYAARWIRGLDGWPLFDSDPTKPEPPPELPPLDLTKPVKRRDGLEVRGARLSPDGKLIYGTVWADRSDCCWKLNGRTYDEVESGTDLIQCVRRVWTMADVPRPWPTLTFRIVGNASETVAIELDDGGIALSGVGHYGWSQLAREWEYSTDGKNFNRCEV